jgi:hypothetical protein
MFLTNNIFIKKFINLKNKKKPPGFYFYMIKIFVKVKTFFGVGGGCRFFVLSSLILFIPSFSDKTTKK